MNFCDKFREFRSFRKFRENKFSRISRIFFKFAKISFRENFCRKNLYTRTFLPLRYSMHLEQFSKLYLREEFDTIWLGDTGEGGSKIQKFSILRWRHFWIMAPYEMKNLTQKIVGTLTSEVEGRRRCCSTSRLFSPFSQKREILTCCWVQTKFVWSDMQNRLQQWLFTL